MIYYKITYDYTNPGSGNIVSSSTPSTTDLAQMLAWYDKLTSNTKFSNVQRWQATLVEGQELVWGPYVAA